MPTPFRRCGSVRVCGADGHRVGDSAYSMQMDWRCTSGDWDCRPDALIGRSVEWLAVRLCAGVRCGRVPGRGSGLHCSPLSHWASLHRHQLEERLLIPHSRRWSILLHWGGLACEFSFARDRELFCVLPQRSRILRLR